MRFGFGAKFKSVTVKQVTRETENTFYDQRISIARPPTQTTDDDYMTLR